MNTRYALWLNGQGLHDLDERILITDIQESAPRMQTSTVANARYDGLRVTRRTRQSLSVTISFLVREYDTARRKELCARVCAWADQGGKLTLSDRPGQYLQVHCDTPPAVTSALRWTDPLTMVFTAWEQPYWQNEFPTSVHQEIPAQTATTLTILPRGSASCCFLEATLSNPGSAAVTSLTVSTGNTMFHLADPALIAPGTSLTIGYDTNGFLTILSGGVSMLHARSADSSDDLLLTPGQANQVTITADQFIAATLKARGIYLA